MGNFTPTANPLITLYNFYRRYLWTDVDFTTWQQGMVQYAQGIVDGTYHGAVLEGFDYLSATGLNITVDAGIAVGPTGNLLVMPAVTGGLGPSITYGATGSFASPTGGNPSRNLVVVRPNIQQTNYITQPTNPNNSVPLWQLQGAQIVFLSGTPASAPQYPATGANDVVLFGVRLAAGATGFATTDIDGEIRDVLGKNSRFQKHSTKYDDRCRVYRAANASVGIKPSQNGNGFSSPRGFTYVNKSVPSIFPKSSGGAYNGAAGDTFLNLQSGTITGADQASSSFTPTIPSAGQCVVATVCLGTSDTLSVFYGTPGTYAQCYAGIESQVIAGAGSVPGISGFMPLAFLIVSSLDGANINDVDTFDARSNFAFGGAPSSTAWPNYFCATESDLTSAITAAGNAGGGVICLLNAMTLSSAHTIPTGTILEGRAGASLITLASSGQITLSDGASMRDVWVTTALTSGNLVVLSNNYSIVRGCQFTVLPTSTVSCIYVTGNANRMYNNIFIGVAGDTGEPYGINYAAGVDNLDDSSVFLP